MNGCSLFVFSELSKCHEFEYPSDVQAIVILHDLADAIQFGKCSPMTCDPLAQFLRRPVIAPPAPARKSGLAGLLGGLAGLLLCLLCLATLGLLGLFATFIAVTAYLGKRPTDPNTGSISLFQAMFTEHWETLVTVHLVSTWIRPSCLQRCASPVFTNYADPYKQLPQSLDVLFGAVKWFIWNRVGLHSN